MKLSFSKSFNTSPSFWEPFFVKNENRNKGERGKRGVKKIVNIKIKNEFVDFITDGWFQKKKNIGPEKTVRSPI